MVPLFRKREAKKNLEAPKTSSTSPTEPSTVAQSSSASSTSPQAAPGQHVNEKDLKLEEHIGATAKAASHVVTARVMERQTQSYMVHHSECKKSLQTEYAKQQAINKEMVEAVRTAQAEFANVMDGLKADMEKSNAQIKSEIEQENTQLRRDLAAVNEVVDEKMMDAFSTFHEKLDTVTSRVQQEEEVHVIKQMDSFHKISTEKFTLETQLKELEESKAEELRSVQAELINTKAELQSSKEAVKRLTDSVEKFEGTFKECRETHTQQLQAAHERFEDEERLKLQAEASLREAVVKQASLTNMVSQKDVEISLATERITHLTEKLQAQTLTNEDDRERIRAELKTEIRAELKTEIQEKWSIFAEEHKQTVKEEVITSRKGDDNLQKLLKMKDEHLAEFKEIVADFNKSREDISSPSPSDCERERISKCFRDENSTLRAELASLRAVETGVQNINKIYEERKAELEKRFEKLVEERQEHDQTKLQLKKLQHGRIKYQKLLENLNSLSQFHDSDEESWSPGVQQAMQAEVTLEHPIAG